MIHFFAPPIIWVWDRPWAGTWSSGSEVYHIPKSAEQHDNFPQITALVYRQSSLLQNAMTIMDTFIPLLTLIIVVWPSKIFSGIMKIVCSICLELITASEDVSSVPCGHVFHTHCILQVGPFDQYSLAGFFKYLNNDLSWWSKISIVLFLTFLVVRNGQVRLSSVPREGKRKGSETAEFQRGSRWCTSWRTRSTYESPGTHSVFTGRDQRREEANLRTAGQPIGSGSEFL